ncbi:putative 26S proteasome non-ATPase regulatory subunit 8 [Diplonema papillatum]|nr:putative 26S proteasome non-ATPase regulatory subunit 8 [Diplonema papillatum]
MSGKAVKEVHDTFVNKFKKLYNDNKVDECRAVLGDLKLQFTEFPTFLNPDADVPTREQEVLLVREILEHAVLLAASTKNMLEFDRYFEMLRSYYVDFGGIPQSERRLLILGLHLLRLLAVNETRSFHMELERIPVADQDCMYIQDVIQLERYIMEGSYHKMLQARKKVPSNHFVPLMEMLLETVRREVFKSAVHAYETLSVDGACKLLMFQSPADLHTFVEEERKKLSTPHAWKLKDQECYTFQESAKKVDTLPFKQLIRNQFAYSHELQRIA